MAVGQPIVQTEADETTNCPHCNYQARTFYRLGTPPEPDSRKAIERGLCARCFIELLTGSGLFPDNEYRVVTAGDDSGDTAEPAGDDERVQPVQVSQHDGTTMPIEAPRSPGEESE